MQFFVGDQHRLSGASLYKADDHKAPASSEKSRGGGIEPPPSE
jgi:hypothetical protein